MLEIKYDLVEYIKYLHRPYLNPTKIQIDFAFEIFTRQISNSKLGMK